MTKAGRGRPKHLNPEKETFSLVMDNPTSLAGWVGRRLLGVPVSGRESNLVLTQR